ncbi:hypothetical protein TIFTF001_050966 [Ficus carica]|uniref:Uncharacterized protein n=1 Tax=Ficus carica TaxID=3494 RepID=A0AA87YPA6_FICCA|nr:hypothetical protein TIFTF001_050966 [Ficus carica]
MEWLRGEKLGDDFDFFHDGSDGRGGESVGGYGVCELGGEESGGGKEFDSAGGGGEDDGREGMEIPTAAMVKARRRCWVEEAILLDISKGVNIAIQAIRASLMVMEWGFKVYEP